VIEALSTTPLAKNAKRKSCLRMTGGSVKNVKDLMILATTLTISQFRLETSLNPSMPKS